MEIYTSDQSKRFCEYRNYYPGINNEKILCFNGSKFSKLKHGVIEPLQDASYHCYQHDTNAILHAISEIKFPLGDLLNDFKVFLLPKPTPRHVNMVIYPKDKIVLLFARGTIIPPRFTEYIFTHEIGHLVQEFLAPDNRFNDSNTKFYHYLELRKWTKVHDKVWNSDKGKYSYKKNLVWKWWGNNPWHLRPTEWFAEDFRYLFGGPNAKQNSWTLDIPKPNKKIKDYFFNLLIT